MPTFLERRKNKKNNIGSLPRLNRYEERLAERKVKLNLTGLEFRIEEELYGIKTRSLPPPKESIGVEEPNPSEENLVRQLEDG